MRGLIVPQHVLPEMALVIKPDQGQVQLRVTVEQHVSEPMVATLNLAVQSVLVRCNFYPSPCIILSKHNCSQQWIVKLVTGYGELAAFHVELEASR